MKKIFVGSVVKAQGIKGEVKINCGGDDAGLFSDVKSLEVDGTTYEIVKLRQDRGCVVVLLKGIDTRNQAELLVGAKVFADKSQLKLLQGHNLIDDLVGCKLVFSDNGEQIGELREVLQLNRAADVLVINRNGKEILLPYLKDVCTKINIAAGKIECDRTRFNQVVCTDENGD